MAAGSAHTKRLEPFNKKGSFHNIVGHLEKHSEPVGGNNTHFKSTHIGSWQMPAGVLLTVSRSALPKLKYFQWQTSEHVCKTAGMHSLRLCCNKCFFLLIIKL